MINKKEAYSIVFEDLRKIFLFKGIYDAKNGNENFMYGIGTVMECIALGVSEKEYENFNNEFYRNMCASNGEIA